MGFAGDHSDLTTIQSTIAKDDTVLKLLFFLFFFSSFFFTRRKTFIGIPERRPLWICNMESKTKTSTFVVVVVVAAAAANLGTVVT